jgi:predicted secreted protein
MTKFLPLTAFAALFAFAPYAQADDFKPDDRIVFDVSAEEWVTTQTARVTVNVDAAVAGNNAATMRTDMIAAVNSLAKADWRLTNFNRSQDQTGLTRWSTSYEARLPESALGGFYEAAKKLSKAGMQLSIADIDFSPTLAEVEAVRAQLRAALTKQANDQLTAMNNALPGRGYRIAEINFAGSGAVPMAMRKTMHAEMVAMDGVAMSASAPMERAQKMVMGAQIVFAALAPVGKQ